MYAAHTTSPGPPTKSEQMRAETEVPALTQEQEEVALGLAREKKRKRLSEYRLENARESNFSHRI